MSKIKELRDKKVLLLAEARKMLDAAHDAGKEMSAEETAAFDAKTTEADTVQASISREEKLADRERATFPIDSGSGVVGGKDLSGDAPWGSFGDFLAATRDAVSPERRGSVDARLYAASGANQSVGSEGGFLVPPAFSTTIWDGLNQSTDNLLNMTDNYTVTGESITFPANAETNRATGSRYGGVRGYWISEAAQMTGSKPAFRRVKIEPQQLAVLCYVTEKLLNNSPVALEQYITRAATDEINFLVGDAIINGSGSGQPKGILNSGSFVSVAKASGQANTTFLQENVGAMWARLHPRSKANAVWLMNNDVTGQLSVMNTLVLNRAGTEVVGGYGPRLYNPEAQTLYGRPIQVVEYCATLGAVGDVILADMKGYLSGTRGTINSAMSMHLRFDYAEMCYRFMFDVDGTTWLASPLTPYKGAATLSTFVVLAAR